MKRKRNDLIINIPIKPNPFKNANFSPEQKLNSENAINEAVCAISNHFLNGGAWGLNMRIMYSDYIKSVFKEDLFYSFISEVLLRTKGTKVEVVKDFTITDVRQKVFYNESTNSIYIATKAKNVNTDVNLGLL